MVAWWFDAIFYANLSISNHAEGLGSRLSTDGDVDLTNDDWLMISSGIIFTNNLFISIHEKRSPDWDELINLKKTVAALMIIPFV